MILRKSRELGVFPLPSGERVRVRGVEPIDRPYPLTPPLSPWEREPTEFAAPISFTWWEVWLT
jgi:hypothetical protein